MRKSVLLVLLLALVAALPGIAQMKKPKGKAMPKTTNTGTFQRISRDDAFKLYKQDNAVFVDVRSNEQFSYGHIKGALSIPNSQLVKRFNEVPPGKTVITYCACDAEQSSGRGAVNLMSHGVRNVYALKGGWNEWKAAGLPIAVGPK
jgi:rhodanese-related sulfurtransferase